VTEAATGGEALARIVEDPDLVILDIRLPDISGFEVCRRIKENPRSASTPVLHLTASFITGQDKAHGLDSGADAYLIRPVEPVELIATVNALLRARRSEEALRASEARYRTLIETLPQLVWTCAADGKCDYLSTQWVAYTGVPEAEQLGFRWLEQLHPDDRARTIEKWTATFQGRSEYDLEYRIRAANGTYRWFKTRGLPTRDAGGRVVKWLGTCTDIEDQKRVEGELRRATEDADAARAAAESANRLKDDFLATLSHELRTPLNAIIGWSQILGGGDCDKDDLIEGLETIGRNARVQAQLIEDLLDVSRIISGKLRLLVQQVDLSTVIDAAMASVRPSAEVKGVRLLRAAGGDMKVTGDPGRLQQVVWNLLSNAIKFTPRGGQVLVTLAHVDSQAQIVVSDTGRGISPDFIPHVFERFRQADASSRRQQGGLGLGLAIVRQLVELHGGTVSAISGGPGNGATFTVKLPTAVHPKPNPDQDNRPAEVSASGTYENKGDARINSAPRLDGVRVLIVDDETDARMLLRRVLERGKATVTVASSAREAMAALKAAPFDVLISDVGMPDTDGYDLIRMVRELPAEANGKTPAVALTAFARSEDRHRVLSSGFQEHIAKPVDAAELLAVIAKVVGESRG
jgi:PAS domain S-box-containing protein